MGSPRVEDVDVAVLAGDTDVKGWGVAWAPVIYVMGNHEYYGEALPRHLEKLRERCRGTNVHLLENDAVEIQGVVFLGATLWTDFELSGNRPMAELTAVADMNDFQLIRISGSYRRLTPQYVRGLHHASKNWLREEIARRRGERIVVVTHHAPSERSIAPRYAHDPLNPAFASRLDNFVEESGASYWIHGHMHNSSNYMIGRTRVLCNPRGHYPHDVNADFLPSLVVEV